LALILNIYLGSGGLANIGPVLFRFVGAGGGFLNGIGLLLV
jgi:hypothetical protein